MSGPNGHPDARRTQKFQIASRIGAFRDSISLSDPLGTSARFIVTRKGSNLHKKWAKEWMDSDPILSAMSEEMVVGSDPIVLSEEEGKTVEALRTSSQDQGVLSLLPILGRLVETSESLERNRIAIRKAVASGRASYSDAMFQGARRYTEEALFLLRWESMPDAEGEDIPYSLETARELLENDTPLEDAGLDDILLSFDFATLTIPADLEADPPTPEKKIIFPGLTLGRFYTSWTHHISEQKALFRDQVLEAAGKNSLPPSDQISLSGGGISAEGVS